MNLYAPTPTAAEYDAAQEVNASYFNPDADPSKGGERTPARAFQAGWLEGAPEPRRPILANHAKLWVEMAQAQMAAGAGPGVMAAGETPKL